MALCFGNLEGLDTCPLGRASPSSPSGGPIQIRLSLASSTIQGGPALDATGVPSRAAVLRVRLRQGGPAARERFTGLSLALLKVDRMPKEPKTRCVGLAASPGLLGALANSFSLRGARERARTAHSVGPRPWTGLLTQPRPRYRDRSYRQRVGDQPRAATGPSSAGSHRSEAAKATAHRREARESGNRSKG